MSKKRQRETFEADLQAQQSPYVIFGTPLPPLDPDVRDDGSYVPVWKQEVTDERGRKRLHGAFTGGFSAGYYNTVGSKDGWTPATFVSSRSSRKKDGEAPQQKAEDFMDEEDLADAEEARNIATRDTFSALGSTSEEASQRATVMDVFRVSGETMGTKLLRKMGWREGQGIGPRVRRKARLDTGENPDADDPDETHWFAPANSQMISFVRKNDYKGLGLEGEDRLSTLFNGPSSERVPEEDDDERIFSTGKRAKKRQEVRGSFGVGIFNDDGSGDEDPFQMGPRLAYNKTVAGDKKKNKKSDRRSLSGNPNPLLRSKPVFISKKLGQGKEGTGTRRCHDGRPPLPGFVLSTDGPVPLQERKYPPPEITPDWKPSRLATSADCHPSVHQSTADLARASIHDPSSRADLLGEAKLPGKSVFDFLTPAARSRIVSLTNNTALPAAGSESPAVTNPNPFSSPVSLIPSLDSQIAANALGRGVAGFIPYTDNPEKLTRYRAFLSFRANLTPQPPARPVSTDRDDWLKELHEFAHAATIFKPMTGMMASRFTSSSSTSTPFPNASATDKKSLLSKPQKPTDPALEAAGMGMFGPLTRSSQPFYPSRLLCKRFNVPVPVTAQVYTAERGEGGGGIPSSTADSYASNPTTSAAANQTSSPAPGVSDLGSRYQSAGFQSSGSKTTELLGKDDMEALRRAAGLPEWKQAEGEAAIGEGIGTEEGGASGGPHAKPAAVDPDRNEALEAERPGDAVFKAIFGSDSEDD